MPLSPPTRLESSLEHLLSARVRALGGIPIKMMPVVKGTPDRLVLLPVGRVYLVELKADREQPSEAQKVWHERAAAIGVNVVVLRGAGEIVEWIRSVAEEQGPQ